MRGRGAKWPLRGGGRKLPLRVGGLRGKGKRRDGADSRWEPVRSVGPSGRRAPAHTRPRGGRRSAAGAPPAPAPAPPPSAALPAVRGLDATPRLLPLRKPSNPAPGLFSLSSLPHPRCCPITLACPTLNQLLRDLVSSLNACGHLKVHRGRRAVLFRKHFLIATARLEIKERNH